MEREHRAFKDEGRCNNKISWPVWGTQGTEGKAKERGGKRAFGAKTTQLCHTHGKEEHTRNEPINRTRTHTRKDDTSDKLYSL